MLDMFRSEEDARRHWRRVPVRFTMHCRRLGRGEHDMVVDAVDLSPGGVRLRAPDRLITGDIVLCWSDNGGSDTVIGFKGLVVHSQSHRGDHSSVHIAWTNLSPESREELSRLLRLHDAEQPTAGA